jgi:hypothetical protein
MNISVDYGRKPGKIPPPIQIRPADKDGSVPEFVTLECDEWLATYQLFLERTVAENFYNLYSVEILA